MDFLVSCRDGVGLMHVIGRNLVDGRFSNVCLEAIDILEGRVAVDGHPIWTEADKLAILLMGAVELQMAVSYGGMVEWVPVGDSGEERSGIFG